MENKKDLKWVEIAREAYKAKEYRRRYEELEKKLMDQLVELSENKESYAGGFKLEQIQRQGSIDYKAIPVLKEINLEQYRRESSSYWKLSATLTEAIDKLGIL